MGKLYERQKHLSQIKNMEKILEIHKQNLKLNFNRLCSKNKNMNWNNTSEDEELILKHEYLLESKINEDNSFVPRFSIKKYNNPLFSKFPPNKEFKYDKELIKMAIEYGMILSVQYRGEEDKFVQGHQRIIYPMVLGTSSKGKPLLRVYHLRGWSVSRNGNTDKLWRMFRTDRILSISFTGSFFRLPPAGYNMNDKGMRGGIIKAANFNDIRRRQKDLVKKDLIQNKKDVVLDEKKGKITVIQTQPTNTILDLNNPWSNNNMSEKDKKIIRITFLKAVHNNKRIAVIGALGKKGNIVKIQSAGKYMGVFKILKSTMGDSLGRPHMKKVFGESKYNLHVFVKKMN